MKNLIALLFILPALSFGQSYPDAKTVMDKVDHNMTAKSSISKSKMVVYGKRSNREIVSKSYSEGNSKNFTEYLSPEREKGTKMLKLTDKLWIYSPSSDRTIQLSGHMLRQSVMGSDLSYEDMMDDRKLMEMYNAKITGEATINGRKTWVIALTAKVEDVSYHSQKLWVDQERYVPLQEERFAKSGQLLKKTVLSDVRKVNSRWYPYKINYKDMLKSGKGTDFIILSIQIDPAIPASKFSKAMLKK